MHLDVIDLRKFYYRSALGRAVQSVIRDKVRAMWPDVRGQTIAGFGFANPLLRPFLSEARRVVALMPGPQGVISWPVGAPNVSVLTEETLWPVPPGSLDRLVMLHGLETSEHPSALLEEAWQALAPGGRAIFIVPNRSGIWSQNDSTPFGFGRPYSSTQLETQLRKHRFVTETAFATLYQPPDFRRFWRKTARFWEITGRRLPFFRAGGVLIAEVTKQVAAPKPPGVRVAMRRPLEVLGGIRSPKPETARIPCRDSEL